MSDIEEITNMMMNTRIAREGGNMGYLTVTLMWDDIADLDLHCVTPDDEHIYFRNRVSRCGGILDIDMNNNWTNMSEHPVENIMWKTQPPKGVYTFSVENFNLRTDENFTDKYRTVFFKTRLIYGNEVKWFSGYLSESEQIVCFKFTV